ncbi:MAG TPA: ABC transporter substrate-binding protein, partial [Propionibacteriaceae bacterium]|nr:ABC transporter substrate-binding protein [Propionibacteriaceae bacterium]
MPALSRRSLLLSSAGLASLPLLNACGGSSAAPKGSAGSATLAFTFWGPAFYQNFTKQMVDIFTKKNPGITVTSQPAEWSSYWDKLATMVAGKHAPDVIN